MTAHSQPPERSVQRTIGNAPFWKREKQGTLYNLHLLLVFCCLFWCTVQWKPFFKNTLSFLYKYVNMMQTVVVICCRHWAHALAGNMCYWNGRRKGLSWIFYLAASCSIQKVSLLFLGHWDMDFVMLLVKHVSKWARGRVIVVQYHVEDWETHRHWKDWERPVGNCEKHLSVTAIKFHFGSAWSQGQRNLLLNWLTHDC